MPEPEPVPEPETTGLQCDPPRSQLEAEQCAVQETRPARAEPEPEPVPDPNYDCPDQPPATRARTTC